MKKVFAIVLALCMVFALCACSGSTNESVDAAVAAAQAASAAAEAAASAAQAAAAAAEAASAGAAAPAQAAPAQQQAPAENAEPAQQQAPEESAASAEPAQASGEASGEASGDASGESAASAPAAATAAATAAAPAAAQGKTVGLAMPTNSLERWNRDGQYLKEQFEAAGYSCILKYSDNDIDQQNNDIQTMIADGVDLLIIVAIDGESLSQTLNEAKEAGIPVIAYDRLIMNTDAVSYYVSFDNYTVGKLQGEFVKQALNLDTAAGPFTIEFTAGDPADNNAGYFFRGAFDTLKPYIDAGKLIVPSGQTSFEQVATPSWSTENALNRFQNILASYYSDGTQLDVALCSNDSTALGVAQAITTDYAGTNKPIITGQDGDVANLRNIVEGIQTMTVYKNVSDEAGVTLEVAKVILSGGTPDASLLSSLSVEAAYDTSSYDNGSGIVPSFLLVPWTVTADNLQDLVDTGLYTWDGQYLAAN